MKVKFPHYYQQTIKIGPVWEALGWRGSYRRFLPVQVRHNSRFIQCLEEKPPPSCCQCTSEHRSHSYCSWAALERVRDLNVCNDVRPKQVRPVKRAGALSQPTSAEGQQKTHASTSQLTLHPLAPASPHTHSHAHAHTHTHTHTHTQAHTHTLQPFLQHFKANEVPVSDA